MDALIHQETKPTPNNHYIVEPISGFLKAKIDRGTFDIERPRMILDFDLNSLSLGLNAEQYRGLISTLDYFNNYAKGVKVWSVRNLKHKVLPIFYLVFTIQSLKRERSNGEISLEIRFEQCFTRHSREAQNLDLGTHFPN